MKSKSPVPREMARRGEEALKAQADPKKAEGAYRYFKAYDQVRFYGVGSEAVRDLAAEVYEGVRRDWGLPEVLSHCEILLQSPFHEAKGLGILVLARYKKQLTADFLETLHRWLSEDRLSSWALVDISCPELLGALLEKDPGLAEALEPWARSENRWVRRASLVAFLQPARRNKLHDAIFRMSARHFADRDDLIQKANGWLLREAGKVDEPRLERFLLQHGPAIPRTTLRYAIERFEESRRKAILERTRPPRAKGSA